MSPAHSPWIEEYPFLTFEARLNGLPAPTWAILGECSSKIEHVANTPLTKDVSARLNAIFLVKGAHGTTAIEGNTLSEAEVAKLVRGELELPESQEYLAREVANILAAYEAICAALEHGEKTLEIGQPDLRLLNRQVLDGLALEAGVVPGEYRQHRVVVSDYRAPSAEHVPELLRRMCHLLNESGWQDNVGTRFVVPILRAIIAHLYIAWIHPFGDGNGRTARLVEFDLLVRAGVPVECAHLLSDYYNRTRSAYYRALSVARRDPNQFITYAATGLREMLKEQLDLIRVQQEEVTWINYVHSVFHKNDDSGAERRRRELALVSLGAQPFTAEQAQLLTTKLAQMYAGKTIRTVQRDLEDLRGRKLLILQPDFRTYVANRNLVRAFRPVARQAQVPGVQAS